MARAIFCFDEPEVAEFGFAMSAREAAKVWSVALQLEIGKTGK